MTMEIVVCCHVHFFVLNAHQTLGQDQTKYPNKADNAMLFTVSEPPNSLLNIIQNTIHLTGT